jgi:hypothetical protein
MISRRDEYLAMGMLHITKAVSFLNNDCKMVRTTTPPRLCIWDAAPQWTSCFAHTDD